MKFLFLLNCLLLTSWPTHKFYFSETLIEWKDPSTLQVTIKVFADDLENATQTNQPDYKQDLLDSLYSSYIQLHFQIIDNNEAPIQLEFIGHEKDGEFIYLYLENNHFDKKDVLVQNTILTELFSNQKNLVNYRCDGVTKSIYFFKDSQPQPLQWP